MIRSLDDSGQVTVLVIGLAMLAFAVSGLAIDGTRAFLFRRTLQNAADGASLSGATQLDADLYYRSGGRRAALDISSARGAAQRLLRLRGIGANASIRIEVDRVTVVLRDEIPTMFLRLIGVSSVPVAVVSSAGPRAGSR